GAGMLLSIMHPFSSTPPFAPTAAAGRCTCNAASRRVFSRAPFLADDEAEREESLPTTSTGVLLEVSLGLERGSLSRLLNQPRTTSPAADWQLNPEDRSFSAWFESTGLLLTLGAIGAAIAAILIG